MVGVNQVIMLSLNMVIIASMIGAGGLGFDVLSALRRLDFGAGLEAGFAIVALAIALDRLSQAAARRRPAPAEGFTARHPYLLAALAVLVVSTVLGLAMPAIQSWPEAWRLSTGTFWSDVVAYINVNYFDAIEAVKNAVLLNVLIPVKRFLDRPALARGRGPPRARGLAARRAAARGPHRGSHGPDRLHRALGGGDDHRLPLRDLGGHRHADWPAHRHPRGRT
jgi:hypothetical protein